MMIKKSAPTSKQLEMPGMPTQSHRCRAVKCCTLEPGQQVTYIGKVYGGPRFGAQGTITKTLRSRAVVDMGQQGTWNIPYYFLGKDLAA